MLPAPLVVCAEHVAFLARKMRDIGGNQLTDEQIELIRTVRDPLEDEEDED